MKRRLDLNEHSSLLFGLPIVFLMVGLAFFGLERLAPFPALNTLGLIAFAITGLLTAIAVFLVALEQVQDWWIDRTFRQKRSHKIDLGNGVYQCGLCSSKNVGADDATCPICGFEFER